MLAFVIRRLMQAVGVIVVVALISFALFRFVGDPINQVVVQGARFIANAAHFNFGISYQFKRPVSDIIAERLPATLELSVLSAIFALLVGVPMGVYTGLYPASWLSRAF